MGSARLQIVELVEATGGGTRRHLRDLVTGLNRDRFSLSVIASPLRESAFQDDVRTFRALGTRVELLPMVRAIHPWHDALALTRLISRFRTWHPDVVHTHSSKAGFLGRCAARIAHVPRVIHTPHCFAFSMDTSPAARRVYLDLERLASRWTDRIICVCRAEREQAVAHRVAPEARLTIVENGIAAGPTATAAADRARLRRELGMPPDAFVVGTIGRLCRQKGHQYLLAAVRTVREHVPQARFLFVGDGELRGRLQELAAQLGVAEYCTWVGHREDAASLMPAFDVIALPSRWEALPYALLDAMAAGLPVVVAAVGGMPEAVRAAEAGLVVAPKDAAGLAAAITRLAQQPELRHDLGVNGRRALESRFRLADMLRQLEAVYENRSFPAEG